MKLNEKKLKELVEESLIEMINERDDDDEKSTLQKLLPYLAAGAVGYGGYKLLGPGKTPPKGGAPGAPTNVTKQGVVYGQSYVDPKTGAVIVPTNVTTQDGKPANVVLNYKDRESGLATDNPYKDKDEGWMPDYLQGTEGWVPDYFQGKEGLVPDWLQGWFGYRKKGWENKKLPESLVRKVKTLTEGPIKKKAKKAAASAGMDALGKLALAGGVGAAGYLGTQALANQTPTTPSRNPNYADHSDVVGFGQYADHSGVEGFGPYADHSDVVGFGPYADHSDVVPFGPYADHSDVVPFGPYADHSDVVGFGQYADHSDVVGFGQYRTKDGTGKVNMGGNTQVDVAPIDVVNPSTDDEVGADSVNVAFRKKGKVSEYKQMMGLTEAKRRQLEIPIMDKIKVDKILKSLRLKPGKHYDIGVGKRGAFILDVDVKFLDKLITFLMKNRIRVR